MQIFFENVSISEKTKNRKHFCFRFMVVLLINVVPDTLLHPHTYGENLDCRFSAFEYRVASPHIRGKLDVA